MYLSTAYEKTMWIICGSTEIDKEKGKGKGKETGFVKEKSETVLFFFY